MKANKIKNVLKNEEGSGLVLSLMVLVVLSVLGAALGMVTINSHNLADINRDSTSAYYIAEAGANMAYEEISDLVQGIYSKPNITDGKMMFEEIDINLIKSSDENYSVYNFEEQYGQIPTATVEIIDREIVEENQTQKYVVKSVGEVDGKSKTVEKEFIINWLSKNPGGSLFPGLPGNAAITVNGDLAANVMPTINGTVYMTDKGKLKIGNNNGNNFHGVNKTEVISDSEWEQLSKAKIPIPEKPIIKHGNQLNDHILNGKTVTLQITEDSYMKELSFSNDSTLKVDTKGNSVVLVIDKLSLDNATIEVFSGGNLTIYYTGNGNLSISNKFRYNGSLIVPNSHIKQNGSPFEMTGDMLVGGDIEIKNNPLINGNIYADGHIELHGATVNGLIVSTKHINFYNKSTLNSLVMAPSGKVYLQDDSILTGSLVAKSIDFSNSVTINQSDEYKKYLPGNNNSNGDTLEDDVSNLIISTLTIEK